MEQHLNGPYKRCATDDEGRPMFEQIVAGTTKPNFVHAFQGRKRNEGDGRACSISNTSIALFNSHGSSCSSHKAPLVSGSGRQGPTNCRTLPCVGNLFVATYFCDEEKSSRPSSRPSLDERVVRLLVPSLGQMRDVPGHLALLERVFLVLDGAAPRLSQLCGVVR